MSIFKRIKYQIKYKNLARKRDKAEDDLVWCMRLEPHNFIKQNVYGDLWYGYSVECNKIKDLLKED